MDNGYLNEDQLIEIENWKRGRALAAVINTEGCTLLLDRWKTYMENAQEALWRLAPGDPTVPTAHAAASALTQLYRSFMEDIDRDIAASYDVPEALKQTLQTPL